MHLPLNPIDKINQPDEYFLTVQDAFILCSGGLWSIAYVLYIRQSFIDKSYGMPILSLCANIAWELIYGVIRPPGPAEFIIFLPYFIIDIGIIYTTIKFGPREFANSPLVANNLGLIILVGSGMMLWAHWAFVELYNGPVTEIMEAGFWAGYSCQVIVSWAAISQLIRRGSTRGHTMAIWACRFAGTLFATAIFHWRVYHYPKDYAYVSSPMARFLFIAPEIAELAYPFVFSYVASKEKRQRVQKVQ